ncbi:MAG: efflux RND transporter periplasmic adaptor subunit [Magnetococcales bacterium]|nr:efflux RND transporter periplasmic adaptor subunit [Magnetococcales bacterium]
MGLGRFFMLFTLLALLIAGGYYGWRNGVLRESAKSSLSTVSVQQADLEDTVTATGTLQPKEFVDVGTQVSGQLKTLHVGIGAVVQVGELLAEMDPTLYQSKVDAGRAQLRYLEAQLADRQAQRTLAERRFNRQQHLMRDDATAIDAQQSAEATLHSAKAQVEALQAQKQQMESTLRGDLANLGYTSIYAPMAGTVMLQVAKQGQTLNANQQAPIIVRIADLSTMTVQAQVSEADIPKLRLGMPVYFTTLGSSERYHSTLRQISPTPNVVNNVVLYDALFDVPNPDHRLMTQMTAQVFFVVAAAKDALQIPLTALQPPSNGSKKGEAGHRTSSGNREAMNNTSGTDPRSLFADGRARVQVLENDGEITEREVQVGVMNRFTAQILSGLELGEKVLTGGNKATAAESKGRKGRSALTPMSGRHP